MQHGGLKLRYPDKYTDEGLIGFQPIINMINSPDSTLKILSYSSLKGFIFSLHVKEEYSEFLRLDDTFTRFNKPITSFVLKLVIISTDMPIRLPPYMKLVGNKKTLHPKSTETESSFFQECEIQQKIWIESIKGGREPICPSVANLVFFTNSKSKKILNLFKLKIDANNPQYQESLSTIQYVLSIMSSPNYKLSIMTMPLENKVDTLYNFEIKTPSKLNHKNIFK
jgi:hypothetical protein